MFKFKPGDMVLLKDIAPPVGIPNAPKAGAIGEVVDYASSSGAWYVRVLFTHNSYQLEGGGTCCSWLVREPFLIRLNNPDDTLDIATEIYTEIVDDVNKTLKELEKELDKNNG